MNRHIEPLIEETLACEQALLFGRASGEAARGRGKVLSSSPRSRVLARLALLAQMGELLRKPGDEVELFWLFEKNGGTVGRTLYSFYEEILSKNTARTARSQLDGQHLLFGVYLQT